MQKTGEKNVDLNNAGQSGISNINDLESKMRGLQKEKSYNDPNEPNHTTTRQQVRRLAQQIVDIKEKG